MSDTLSQSKCEWKEYSIEDFAEVKNTLRIPLSKLEREKRQGDFPYYGASGVIDYVDDFLFEGEHVLISEDGENLKSRKTPIAFKADGKFWVNNHAHILKGKRDEFNDLLVYYFANLNINEFITGAVQPKLSKSNLLSIPMFLPEDEEVILEIVSFIKSLTEKIDLLHRQNQTLEQMAETLFRQWFVEEASEDWKEGVVADLAEHFKKTIKPPQNEDKLFNHYSIPSYDNSKEPAQEIGKEIKSNKYEVPINCILFSKLNPHKDKRVWLLQDNLLDNPICSTEFQIVYPKNDNSLYFLYGWLSINKNYREIASGIGGTSGSHQRINPSEIFDFTCPIIPDEQLSEYSLEVEPIYKKQFNNQTQIRTLEKLRDTLLPKLMSGEAKVNK
jgi:type I restriction enzyme, S subunit